LAQATRPALIGSADWRPPLLGIAHYLLANCSEVTQNDFIMKRYFLLGFIITAMTCSSLLAQEKAGLQANATVLSLLQGSVGKGVELHLRSGEKLGGKVAQVTDSVVHLSNLAGAEFFDAFVDVKDISAVVVRVAGR
jgi:hypothetical protein